MGKPHLFPPFPPSLPFYLYTFLAVVILPHNISFSLYLFHIFDTIIEIVHPQKSKIDTNMGMCLIYRSSHPHTTNKILTEEEIIILEDHLWAFLHFFHWKFPTLNSNNYSIPTLEGTQTCPNQSIFL